MVTKLNRQFRRLLILMMSLSLVFLFACSSETTEETAATTSDTTTPTTTGGGGTTAVTLNASVSGTVSSTTITSSSSYAKPGDFLAQQFFAETTNSCSNADFDVFKVGGDGTAISSGTADNGTFDASMDADHEVVLKFSTSGCDLKCFGKAGTTDLVCDPISYAIVLALENSLGASVESSSLFEGLSIAKIAEGMVETLKLMSALDPTNNIIAKLEAALAAGGDVQAAMAAIIEASPVGALFESLATLAAEKKAENTAIAAGDSAADAITAAAEASWTVEKLIGMLTGTGLVVYLDFDQKGGMGLYSDLFTQVDTWVDTDFIASLRTYVGTLYDQLYVQKETLNVSLVCIARDMQKWDAKPIKYPPYKKADGMLTCMDPATTDNETDAFGITINNGTEMAPATDEGGEGGGPEGGEGDFPEGDLPQSAPEDGDGGPGGNYKYELSASIRGSFDEPDRNDPTGERSKEHGGFEEFGVHFIDIFPEFDEALESSEADGGCGEYVSSGNSQEGEEFLDGFAECVQRQGLGNYFSGLLGMYQFMRKSDLRGTKFSLEDLYGALTETKYMGMRLQGDLWQAGVQDNWINVEIPRSEGGSFNMGMSAWSLIDSGNLDDDGNSIYNLECAVEGQCTSGVPGDGPGGGGPIEMTAAEYTTLINSNVPSYVSTMGTFEEIPTLTEIKTSIFQDAHHEPYNIAGPKTFNVKGAAPTTGNDWEADAPVLCQIANPNAAGDFLAGTSSITCDKANAEGITWDSDGKPSDLEYYKAYYALQERGGGGGDAGGADRFYSLININNGTDYRLNGREFRIRGVMATHAATNSLNVDGTTMQSVNDEFCDTWQNSEGNMETHCWHEKFDFVGVELPDALFPTAFYNPFSWDIPMTSTWTKWVDGEETIETFEWNMQIAVSNNGTADDFEDDVAVCLHPDDVSTDSSEKLKVLSVTIDSTADIVNCFTTTQETFYYLTPQWGSSKADFKYQLVRNDGSWMYSQDESDIDKVPFATVEAVVGSGYMGPATAVAWLNHYEIANLGHDAKFDPYCDDLDSDGVCGFTDVDGDGVGTLVDEITEPTLSEPPFWHGSDQADTIRTILRTCGGDEGVELATCLRTLKDAATPVDISQTWADWNKLFTCPLVNGGLSPKTLRWVDTWQLVNGEGTDYHKAGDGCGLGTEQRGSVRLRKLIKRNNAYDVARPNKMLKLISAATASSGTGVTIAATDQVFNFQEAMALLFLRFTMPMDVTVHKDGVAVGDVPVFLNKVQVPGQHGEPTSGLLRAFLDKAGVFD